MARNNCKSRARMEAISNEWAANNKRANHHRRSLFNKLSPLSLYVCVRSRDKVSGLATEKKAIKEPTGAYLIDMERLNVLLILKN